jgi:hypothetical protein
MLGPDGLSDASLFKPYQNRSERQPIALSNRAGGCPSQKRLSLMYTVSNRCATLYAQATPALQPRAFTGTPALEHRSSRQVPLIHRPPY